MVCSGVVKSTCSTLFGCFFGFKNKPEWLDYALHSHIKVVLKCSESLLESVYHKYKDRTQSIWCLDVEDEGRTQVSAGTRTAVVFKPMRKIDVSVELETLKL